MTNDVEERCFVISLAVLLPILLKQLGFDGVQHSLDSTGIEQFNQLTVNSPVFDLHSTELSTNHFSVKLIERTIEHRINLPLTRVIHTRLA